MSAEVMGRLKAAIEGSIYAEAERLPGLVDSARRWLEGMNPEADARTCVLIARNWPSAELGTRERRAVIIRFFESFPEDFTAGKILAGLEVKHVHHR